MKHTTSIVGAALVAATCYGLFMLVTIAPTYITHDDPRLPIKESTKQETKSVHIPSDVHMAYIWDAVVLDSITINSPPADGIIRVKGSTGVIAEITPTLPVTLTYGIPVMDLEVSNTDADITVTYH